MPALPSVARPDPLLPPDPPLCVALPLPGEAGKHGALAPIILNMVHLLPSLQVCCPVGHVEVARETPISTETQWPDPTRRRAG